MTQGGVWEAGGLENNVYREQKNGDISEDELKGDTKDIQTKTDEFTKKIDGMLKEKEKEIMSV